MTAKPAAVAVTALAGAMPPREPAYRRILLKLSGEALMGERRLRHQPRGDRSHRRRDRARSSRLGVEVAVVIGGGNIFRGVAPGAAGMDRATADYMGMLATLMNALALQDALRRAGVESRVQSALRIDQVAEPYIRGRALRHLEERQGRHLRRRHRQPVLHHRHRGGAARARNGRRHRAEGDQGRRRLHRRSEERRDGDALLGAHLRRGDRQESEGDGRDGARAVPRPEHAAQGVLDLRSRRARSASCWAGTKARWCIARTAKVWARRSSCESANGAERRGTRYPHRARARTV